MDLAKRATDYFVTSIREIPNSKTYENSTLPEEVAGIVTELKQEVLPKIEEISQGIDLVKQGQMTLVELRDKFQTVRASMLKCGQELNGLPGYRAYRARTNEANR